MSLEQTYECPKCHGAKYDQNLNRCTMCAGIGKVEDGGRSTIYGDKEMHETPYIGPSGLRAVINLPTAGKN